MKKLLKKLPSNGSTMSTKKVKERKYNYRDNQITHMIKFKGDEELISDLEIEKGGRKYFFIY